MISKNIIVSACLVGIKCRYNGTSKQCQKIIKLFEKGHIIPVCPEQLGGLPTPRSPAELKNGRVITRDGNDVTSNYLEGANESLKIAKLLKVKKAILKSLSPSCGSGKIYDGTFSGKLINGVGVFAGLLKKNKIEILTEEEI